MISPIRVILVCGARPNFMKIAPIMRAMNSRARFSPCLVHTGQHYDHRMSRLFFDDLGIPEPDLNLEVGSASHAVQTAEIMKHFEPVVLEHEPDYVLVVGDVNSTVACGLVGVKLGAQLIHVEAGLRSFDRTMPEEINRIVTDAISDVLFVSEPSGVENLTREGIAGDRIHFVGNVMIDTLLSNRDKAADSPILDILRLTPKEYGVLTLHRPSNVDDKHVLDQIVSAHEGITPHMPVVFPAHPRTRKSLESRGFMQRIQSMKKLILMEPTGYLDFLKLMSDAAVVLTDSGGIQEETTILGVPCLTLRDNTERPVTVTEGTNRLVKRTAGEIIRSFETVIAGADDTEPHIPALWDGKAAERIVDILEQMTS